MDKFQKNKYRFSSMKPLILVGDDIIEARNEQINELLSELIKYKVLLRDLIGNDISYSIRNELLNIALFVVQNVELYDSFITNVEIPIEKLCREVCVTKKYIDKYREYIIAYILIFGNPNYKYIHDYIQIVEQDEENIGTSIVKYKEEKGVSGLVVGKNKKNAIIVTSLGEFKKVALVEGMKKGDEVSTIEKKSLVDYKMYISIIVIFAVVFVLSLVYKYNNVVRTIVIDTTSPIKLEINGFNRVLRITSPTQKGKKMIGEINIQDKEMDKALLTIIEYADNNEMVKDSGIVVTITGKELEYDSIEETEEYIYKKDISVRFNNSGAEHKIN